MTRFHFSSQVSVEESLDDEGDLVVPRKKDNRTTELLTIGLDFVCMLDTHVKYTALPKGKSWCYPVECHTQHTSSATANNALKKQQSFTKHYNTA